MRTLRIAAVAIAGVALITVGQTPVPATGSDFPAQYVDSAVSETPNSVAVADSGVIVAGLQLARSIALISPDGTSRIVEIGCATRSVEINPEGTTAWAVCIDDRHVRAIDVASGVVSVFELGMNGGEDVVYLPETDELLVSARPGSLFIIHSVASGNYIVRNEIPSDTYVPTVLAPFSDGFGTFAISDTGALLWFDLDEGGFRVEVGTSTTRAFIGLSMDPSERVLYAAVMDYSDLDNVRTRLESIDMATVGARQVVELNLTPPTGTPVDIAAGYRRLYVTTGTFAPVGGQMTGLLQVDIDARGRLGSVHPLTREATGGGGVDRSQDGSRVALSTTSPTVQGLLVNDEPYPTIESKARIKRKLLTLRGSSIGLVQGTKVTVHIKDLTAKKPRFIAQKSKATIGSSGGFRWQAPLVSQRFSFYVTAGDAISATSKIVIRRSP